jgi:hypothetical protein
MSSGFDSQRSEAIRAGLVAEAAPVARRRWPWRGLILVLTGALVGSGATTVAFANGQGLPLGPTAPSSSGAAEPGAVVVIGSGVGEASPGEDSAVVSVTTDGKSGKPRVEFQWDQRLRELSRQQLVVTDPAPVDLSGRPTEASYAWVALSCRGQGSVAIRSQSAADSFEVVEGGDGKESGGMAMATMVVLDDSVDVITPTKGCVADVSITYFAKA